MGETERVACALVVLCGSELHEHDVRAVAFGRFKHLPFVNTDSAPCGRAAVGDIESPFLCGDGCDQFIGDSRTVAVCAVYRYPIVSAFVLNGKSNCVHVLSLAAVLGVFNSNSFDGSRLVEFYRHPAALLIRGAPFGTVFARSVNSLPCGFAVILSGIAGDFGQGADVYGNGNIAQLFGIAVFIGPIDCEAGAFAANTVCVYGNDLNGNICLVIVADKVRNIIRGVGRFHYKCSCAVRIEPVNLVGGGVIAVPLDARFGGVCVEINDFLKPCIACACSSRFGIGDGKPADVDLIVGNIACAADFKADRIEFFAAEGSEGNIACCPAAAACVKGKSCFLAICIA